jgi:cytosine/adenosine deaminase-related metal-dependent hydrolase
MLVRGPLLNPRTDGGADFWPDGALWGGADGAIRFVGAWTDLVRSAGDTPLPDVRRSEGMIVPAFLDCHTHIPQYPIAGGLSKA